jgi:hypothetical protein
MKRLILLSVLVVSFLTLCAKVAYSDFCNGWNDGYKQGWCYGQDYCIPPIPPLCPVANIGETTYKHGYNRGFIAGRNAK